VKNKNLNFKNNINPNKIKNGSINKLNKKFEKVFIEVKKEIKNKNETLNVLNNKFKFNFKLKSLDKFKKFNTIAIIGMGGSILGAEAIYNFFQSKIKKKIYFFNDLDENKITNFKKKIF